MTRLHYLQKFFFRLSVTATIALPAVSLSREGFYESPNGLPPQVSAAWDAVFSLMIGAGKEQETSTAFLIGQDKDSLYFATVNHALHGCSQIRCENAILYQDVVLERSQNGRSFSFTSSSKLSFDQIEIHRRTSNPDFAVLRVRVDSRTDRTSFPHPLRLLFSSPRIGEPIFQIGFPRVQERTCTVAGRINQVDRIVKRWSVGVSSGERKWEASGSEPARYWVTSTADSLGGSSGGPMLNAAGDVISILAKSRSWEVDGNCYHGSDDPGQIKEYSYGIRNFP